MLEAVDDVLDEDGDPEALGRELFEVVDVLDSQPTLRRIFTDSSIEESGKNGLLRDVLEGKVSDAALDLMTVAVARRWNEMRDLADAVEQAGVTATSCRRSAPSSSTSSRTSCSGSPGSWSRAETS